MNKIENVKFNNGENKRQVEILSYASTRNQTIGNNKKTVEYATVVS